MANSIAMLEVQAQVFTVMKADAQLLELTQQHIYDAVPQGVAFPYVELGEFEEVVNSVFGKHGSDVTVTLHIYSIAQGYQEGEKILLRLDTLFDDTKLPDTTNFSCFGYARVISSGQKEFDAQEIRHLIARYLFQVESKT